MSEIQEHVKYLSQGIGPRPAGTEEEQQAALYVFDRVRHDAGLPTVIEEFNCSPKYDIPRILFCVVALIMAVLAFFFPLVTIPALIVAVVVAVFYLLDVTDHSPFERFLRLGISQNIVAKYEPTFDNGVPSKRRRKIILVAHYDSDKIRREYKGVLLALLPVIQWAELISMILVPVLLLVRLFWATSGIFLLIVNILLIVCSVLILVSVIIFLVRHLSVYNEAANCNAAGVSVMMDVALRIAEGCVSEDEMKKINRAAVVHGEHAARESGYIPEGAELVYETAATQQPDAAQSPEERLAAAKEALAAFSGVPIENADSGDREDEGLTLEENAEFESEAETFDQTQRGQIQKEEASDRVAEMPEEASDTVAGIPRRSSSKQTTSPDTQRGQSSTARSRRASLRTEQNIHAVPSVATEAADQTEEQAMGSASLYTSYRPATNSATAAVTADADTSYVGRGTKGPRRAETKTTPPYAEPKTEHEFNNEPELSGITDEAETPVEVKGSAKGATKTENIIGGVVDTTAAGIEEITGETTETVEAAEQVAEDAAGEETPETLTSPEEEATPAWFRTAQEKAKKPESEGTPAQRSRYADALEAALDESNVHFSQANKAISSEAELRLQQMRDNIMEIKAPSFDEFGVSADAESAELFPEDTFSETAKTAGDASENKTAAAAATSAASSATAPSTGQEKPGQSDSEVSSATDRTIAFIPVAIDEDELLKKSTEQTQGTPSTTGVDFEENLKETTTVNTEQAPEPLPDFVVPRMFSGTNNSTADDNETTVSSRKSRSLDLPGLTGSLGAPISADSATSEEGKQRAPLADDAALSHSRSQQLRELPLLDDAVAAGQADVRSRQNLQASLQNALPSLSGSLGDRNQDRESAKSDIGSSASLNPLTQDIPAEETEEEPAPSVSQAGSFGAIGATGAFSPVGEELVEGVDPDEVYVEDADDSDYEEQYTETGAFAGPGYVDMPTSRVSRFFGRIFSRRNKKEEQDSAQEWLGVDDEFDAHEVGKARGGWESFREEEFDETTDDTPLNYDDYVDDIDTANVESEYEETYFDDNSDNSDNSEFNVGYEDASDLTEDEVHDDPDSVRDTVDAAKDAAQDRAKDTVHGSRSWNGGAYSRESYDREVAREQSADNSHDVRNEQDSRNTYAVRDVSDVQGTRDPRDPRDSRDPQSTRNIRNVAERQNNPRTLQREAAAEESFAAADMPDQAYEAAYDEAIDYYADNDDYAGNDGYAPDEFEEDVDEERITSDVEQIQNFRHPDINTDVWFVALGSELANNGGMKAFLANHASELRGAIFVDLEGLGAGDLTLIEREGIYHSVKTSTRIKRAVRKATSALGLTIGTGKLSWKNTSATYAIRHGFQATHLVGMKNHKPAYCGEIDDVAENTSEDTLLASSDFVMDLLKNL